MFVEGVRLGGWGVVLVVCVCRCRGCCSLSVCVCVCPVDLFTSIDSVSHSQALGAANAALTVKRVNPTLVPHPTASHTAEVVFSK